MKKLLKKIKIKIGKALQFDLKRFQKELECEEARLRERLQSLEVPVIKTHLADLDSTFSNEAYGNGERMRTLKHAVGRCKDAFSRLEKDEYGICEECGDPIAMGRLQAVPFTRHCAKCKTEMEMSWKLRGNPKAPKQTFHP